MHIHPASLYQRVRLIVDTRYLPDAYPPREYLSSIYRALRIDHLSSRWFMNILDIEYLSSIYRVFIEYMVRQRLIVSSIHTRYTFFRGPAQPFIRKSKGQCNCNFISSRVHVAPKANLSLKRKLKARQRILDSLVVGNILDI